jgi:hypothetical protein
VTTTFISDAFLRVIGSVINLETIETIVI